MTQTDRRPLRIPVDGEVRWLRRRPPTSTRFIPGFNSSTPKGLETACRPTALGTASADRRIGEMKTLKNPQYLDVFLASRGRDGKRDHRPYDYWYSWHEDPAAYPFDFRRQWGASTVSGKLVPGVWTEVADGRVFA